MSEADRIYGTLSRIGDLLVDAIEGRSRRVALLFGIFVLFAAMDFGIGAFVTATRLPLLEHGLVDATIHGGLAVVAAWLLLAAARDRRERIRAAMVQAAQMNHEIRNALEVIGQAGYLLNDLVYGPAIAESVERIKKTLDRSKPE